MNRFLSMLLITLMLTALQTARASSSVRSTNHPWDTFQSEAPELTCEISPGSEVHVVAGYVHASLVIKNISDHAVKICTLTGGWRSGGKNDHEEVFRPDFWKSDSPPPEEFAKHIVAIEPGKSVSLKLRIPAGFHRGKPLKISAGYDTGKEFAALHGTWSGSIRATVIVKVIE